MAKVTRLRTKTQPKAAPEVKEPPVVRTGEGLRDVLFDEIDKLRAGTGDRRRALTIASLASQIINTAKVEIEYQRHLALLGREGGAKPEDEKQKLGVLRLGKETEQP